MLTTAELSVEKKLAIIMIKVANGFTIKNCKIYFLHRYTKYFPLALL